MSQGLLLDPVIHSGAATKAKPRADRRPMTRIAMAPTWIKLVGAAKTSVDGYRIRRERTCDSLGA